MPYVPYWLQARTDQTKMILDQIAFDYQKEGIILPYMMEDFRHDYVMEHFKELTPEERRLAFKDLKPSEILEALSPAQRREIRRELLAKGKAKSPKKRAPRRTRASL
jgi:hypothetical protein